MNDLISRKALLEKLSNMQPVGFAQSVAGRVALKEIENAPPVMATDAMHEQWIPFTDPPKRMKAVICLYEDENGKQVGGGYVNDHGIWTLIGPAKGTITHWMHMPELPKPRHPASADIITTF